MKLKLAPLKNFLIIIGTWALATLIISVYAFLLLGLDVSLYPPQTTITLGFLYCLALPITAIFWKDRWHRQST